MNIYSFSYIELKLLDLVMVARFSLGNSLYFKWLMLAFVDEDLHSNIDNLVKFQVAVV